MTTLSKGQNAQLPTPDIVVSVEVGAAADVSALLVTGTGKVRTDNDFVFYNQPTGPGVRLVPGAGLAQLHISTGQVPAEIDAIRAVITLDDASSSFGRFTPPVARVGDNSGRELYSYSIGELSSESVVIALEVYRRNADWKVRAVGQGYAGGFADLVRDHGVSVDDAPAPPAAAPAPSYQPPTAPAPSYQPPAPAPGYQQPPAPAYGQPAPQPGYQAPQSFPPPGQPQSFPPPGRQSFPPPTGAPAAYGEPPAPAGPPPEVNLSKDRPVSLVKGQKVTLRKEGGVKLTSVQMGLGWDPAMAKSMFGRSRASSIDLDASVLMYSQGRCADVVYFGHLKSEDLSIQHSGDNLTGEGDGDDEMVTVALHNVAPSIDTLVFIVTSYRGQTFEEVANAYCRLVDLTTGAELARYTLQGGMPYTGVAMAVIKREGGDWKLTALGDGFQGKTPKDALPHLQKYV
ncbi:stress protein [Gordonia amarae]|uniref:TerD domain-containing protein n=2 Tax=Gordonia amarae TaxID=36821 RepID=G7GUQ0_9ACTN|nr:TerD family protein [Gordonia amarae]MCS3876887.1 stress response protein SCP2 [Gordonia amarae]QHN15720.1 stress protein [Gordonia amarae]QHN20289.1 stress protein [Gordonia amarae]QHN29141.1 stress protein [Gordonia amarae]QHN37920.1 stress protein [Gordonia amarae]